MKYKIPTDAKKWIQPNKGDTFGNLWASFNMDFDSSLGKVRVAPRAKINTDETDDADLGLPLAFVRSSAGTTDQWWALVSAGTTGALFKTAGTDPSAAFTQDAIATGDGTPTDIYKVSSDMVDFEGSLIVSTDTDLHKLTSASWDKSWWDTTLAQTALTTGLAHPLHVTKKTNYLLVGDGNLIHTIDKNSNVKASRLIFPTAFEAIWIRSTYDGTYIGARNKFGGEGMIFFWDESAENYNRAFSARHPMTFAGCIHEGVPYTVNGAGQLLKYTGASFDEVAVFPVYDKIFRVLNDANTVDRNVHRNGMCTIDGRLNILISNADSGSALTQLENFPSGIWTYDTDEGLRHRHSLSLYRSSEIDYGAFNAEFVGALIPTTATEGVFLAGGTIRDSANTAIDAIWIRDTNDSLMKRGHFITSLFEASAFEDVFQDLLVRFRRFRNSGDRIIVKYRVLKNVNFPFSGSGTWVDTDTFTATTSGFANVAAGDEIMFTQGNGAGTTAHVSSITFSTPTYTVNLDETITGATGTAVFLVNNWKKCATISTQSIERQSFDLDAIGTFLQLKVEMRSVPGGTAGKGETPELEEIVVNSAPENII